MSTTVDGSRSSNRSDYAQEAMARLSRISTHRKGRRRSSTVQQAQKLAAQRRMALLDGLLSINKSRSSSGSNTGAESINLADLFARLEQLKASKYTYRQSSQDSQGSTSESAVTVTSQTTEIEITIDINKPVVGLEKINGNYAQTDRYLFNFSDSTTLTIMDKWSGKSTTIWGDPHVDVNDEEGNYDGDFKDLQASERYTTFQLQDGTRLTVTALDSGVIETVDIFHKGQHLRGYGAAYSEPANEDLTGNTAGDAAGASSESSSIGKNSSLFSGEVQKGDGVESSLEKGDVVVAGGDGNDWYSESGMLIWGKTTDNAIYTRPNASLEIKIKQTSAEISWFQGVDFSA